MTDFAWLIERQDSEVSSPAYFEGLLPHSERPHAIYTQDHLKAARFARQEDAAAVARGLPIETRVAEHGWG
jgi:hypothetical protein